MKSVKKTAKSIRDDIRVQRYTEYDKRLINRWGKITGVDAKNLSFYCWKKIFKKNANGIFEEVEVLSPAFSTMKIGKLQEFSLKGFEGFDDDLLPYRFTRKWKDWIPTDACYNSETYFVTYININKNSNEFGKSITVRDFTNVDMRDDNMYDEPKKIDDDIDDIAEKKKNDDDDDDDDLSSSSSESEVSDAGDYAIDAYDGDDGENYEVENDYE